MAQETIKIPRLVPPAGERLQQIKDDLGPDSFNRAQLFKWHFVLESLKFSPHQTDHLIFQRWRFAEERVGRRHV